MSKAAWIVVFFALLMACAWSAVKINERVSSPATQTFIAYSATCVLAVALLGIAYVMS